MLSTELLGFYRDLKDRNFVVADLETTGFKPPIARVTEISVLQANLQEGVQAQYSTLINSRSEVPYHITRVTGITQEMVDEAPDAEYVWPDYHQHLKTGILVCHNLDFDYPFMRSELRNCGIEFIKPRHEQLCTVIFSRLMLPDLPSRSLPNLVKHFGFDVGPSHRAESDTMACWLLLERLLREMMDTDDDELLKRFSRQWLPDRDAATLLNCQTQRAIEILTDAGVRSRSSRKNTTVMYQRGEVERVALERSGLQLGIDLI
jgi:DNA polymerase III subunit epsilon